jgi:hypothetical protein
MPKIVHRFSGEDIIDAVTQTRIKHKDYFHMKNLYIMMHEWLVEEGWASRSDKNWPETFYLHRWTQTAGQEVRIWWRFRKVPTGSSYYCYDLDVDFLVILLREAEVMHNGVKYKANWGDVEIKIWAKLIADYQHKWKKHWFLKHLQRLFFKRIFYKDLIKHKKELYRDTYRLQEAIKTYLNLRTYLPEPELERFWPEKGYE